jgi:S-adenosylmethionine/arginine decarboxylase-like enzyme
MYSPHMTKDEYDKAGAWGLLASVDLHGCNPGAIRDADKIRAFVAALCPRIDMRPFGACQVQYFGTSEEVAGFSMTQFVETSLISGHFVDQTNAVYLDIFACKYFEAEAAARYAADFFEAADHSLHVLLRK